MPVAQDRPFTGKNVAQGASPERVRTPRLTLINRLARAGADDTCFGSLYQTETDWYSS
jgi:hypothetical protein